MLDRRNDSTRYKFLSCAARKPVGEGSRREPQANPVRSCHRSCDFCGIHPNPGLALLSLQLPYDPVARTHASTAADPRRSGRRAAYPGRFVVPCVVPCVVRFAVPLVVPRSAGPATPPGVLQPLKSRFKGRFAGNAENR